MNFETKFFQKGYFWSKIEEDQITIEFCISGLGLVPNLLNWQFWFFWTKFAQNWYSKKLHFCMCPWSLQHFSVFPPSSCRNNKEYSEDLFCKKFTFHINLPNYLYIWIVEYWFVVVSLRLKKRCKYVSFIQFSKIWKSCSK